MKYLTILTLFLVNLSLSRAQTPQLDSLDRLIRQARTDTGRINRINEKIMLLGQINLDSAIALSLKTIAQARQINYKVGEGVARMRLAYNYSFKGNYAGAKANLPLAESTFISLGDTARLIKVYNTYGAMYGMQSKYDSSITFLEKGMALAQQTAHQSDLASIYLNIGISYDMLSNRPQALLYQQKGLTLAQAQNDVNTQAYCLVNMANTYKLMGNWAGAERRYKQAIELAKQAGIRNVELYAYSNLVDVYGQLKAPQKAYTFALRAASLGKETGDLAIQATSLAKAATNLAQQKKFVEAESLNRQAMRIADASGQPLNIHQAYAAMGTILKTQGRYASAIPYYERSFDALKDADIYDSQTGEIYAELSDCYEKTGNYPKALATYKTSAAIADSVRGKENVRKATELTMTYEFTKKQQAAQAEQQKQNALSRTRQLALTAGMGLMLVLAAVSFYAYRTKHKANALLYQQKAALEQTLTKLQATQTQLIHSEKMASLGELTAGIAHEIQNPLNFVTNFSEVSAELLEDIREERNKGQRDEALEEEILDDLSGNLGKIKYHGGRASSIVKSMLEHSRTSTGHKQLTDLNALTSKYIQLAYSSLKAKNKTFDVTIVTTFSPTLDPVEIVPQEIGRVLLNLLNNALYAVQAKQQAGLAGYQPTVSVSTNERTSQLGRRIVEIQIRDNGTGMSELVLAKIFQPFYTTKPPGQGTGLGLSLSYDIITKGHGGQLSVISQEGEFTEFRINFPVTT
ncbi:tetratricopeptide repeat protein [Spirosoma fluviale]|uniref:histidine kinase n=1 Tax=Spirosoma fluviale TaxID=1597977 RepID=A0A286F5A1_9BACT|nr:tetratricopeptide repeat protein [Spirosoma fluviale]SOD78352.1 Tetratricopeptide repeat-containing protein [Spirosoma fluviale]